VLQVSGFCEGKYWYNGRNYITYSRIKLKLKNAFLFS